jgi:hypothetical protein
VEFLGFTFEFHNDDWLVIGSSLNFERPVLEVFLDERVIEFPADQSLGVKDRVMGIFGGLVQSGISY